MAFFADKIVNVWDGGYSDLHHDISMGFTGAVSAALDNIVLVVGGRDSASESVNESSSTMLFSMNKEKFLHEHDNVGTISRRIGHAIAAIPNQQAWFVHGGELVQDNSNCFLSLGDLHRFTYSKNVLQCEKVQVKTEEPTPRAWHTLTCIRCRPALEATTQSSKGKNSQSSSHGNIPTVELDEALVLLGGKDAGKEIWIFILEKGANNDDTGGPPVMPTPKWVKINAEGTSPLPLSNHAAEAIADRTKVIVTGGLQGNVFVDNLSILDTSTFTWSTLITSPLVQRSCHIAVSVNLPSSSDESSLFPRLNDNDQQPLGIDRILIFGGITPNGKASLEELIVVDVAKSTIQTVQGYLSIQSHIGHAVETSGDQRRLYVFGGSHATSHAWLDSATRVDLWSYQHEPLPPPPPERMRTIEYPNGDVYLGELNDANKRHGFGRCTYASGHAYEGHWEDDLWHGQGRLEYLNGDIYEGDFIGNVRHGSGKLSYKLTEPESTTNVSESVFDGEWFQDMRHGQGTSEYTNGAKIKGSWENDILQATATNISDFSDGKLVGLFEGAVQANGLHLPHGPGRFEVYGYPKCGEMYSGAWLHGKRDGQGMCMEYDGTVYMGEWKNGKRNGIGTCDYAKSRDRYEGKWVGNVRCGQGKCTYAAGYIYEGHWAHDKRHGNGRCTYKDGTFYEGSWENDEFCGDGALILQAP